jgi:hypothetical protein
LAWQWLHAGYFFNGETMKKVKVFMCNIDGTNDVLVAAHSLLHASKLIGVQYSFLREYGHETRNTSDCALALSNPGTVYMAKISSKNWIVKK